MAERSFRREGEVGGPETGRDLERCRGGEESGRSGHRPSQPGGAERDRDKIGAGCNDGKEQWFETEVERG